MLSLWQPINWPAWRQVSALPCVISSPAVSIKNSPLIFLITGLPGVIVGANVILWVPGKNAEMALGVLTPGLGLYSAFKKDLGQVCTEKNRDARTLAAGGLVLFLLGTLNGSLTSGSGLFVTVWLVRWFGLDYKRAIAYTLILVGMFWNGTGALTPGVLGEIRWDWIPMLLAGSLLGAIWGRIWPSCTVISGSSGCLRQCRYWLGSS